VVHVFSSWGDGRLIPHPVRWTGCGIGLLLLLAGAPGLGAQGTPAGTQIITTAQVTYQSQNGESFTAVSNAVVMVVGQVGGVDLDPPGASTADPGVTVSFAHTLRNIGNGTDSFTVAAASRAGWPVRVYLDQNGNGAKDTGEPLASAPIAIASGAIARLVLETDVPALASVRGTTDTLRLFGASQFDPAATDTVVDLLQVRTVGVVVALVKDVDRSSATTGDVLTYTVRYSATGSGTATNFQIVDPIPLGTTYVPGTLRVNGAVVTDSPGDDAGAFDAVLKRVLVTLASLAGGENGAITFQVRVGP